MKASLSSCALSRGVGAAVPSRNGQRPTALVDLTVPQLAEAYSGLDRLEREYENLSGVCATLKGLVLLEAKSKPELKGRFKEWISKSFPKTYRTAARYMRLAEAFGRSDSTVTFQILKQSLADSLESLRSIQLDLSHPVVAKVAEWVNGRGSYQLMLDFPGSVGGDTSAHRKKLSSAEIEKQSLENAKREFCDAIADFDRVHNEQLWKASSVTDAHLETAIELAREFARDASAFLRTPRRDRYSLEMKS
jgi:hypothetical protein